MLCDCFSGRDRSNTISLVAERARLMFFIGQSGRKFPIGQM
jgi:hypothetical protein